MSLKSKSILKSVILFFAGLLTTFLLIEGTIRIAGRLYLGQKTESLGRKDDQFRILFLGNSHTYGYGIDPSKAYANVLEEFFHQEVPSYKISVFKEAIIAGTTRNLIERFDEVSPRIRPNLVVVMGGEPNIWNKYGFSEFITHKNSAGEHRFKERMREFLGRSRFLRWLYSLSDLPVRSTLTRDQENELDFYLLAGEFDSVFDPEMVFRNVPGQQKILSTFILRHKNETGLSPLKARLFLGYLQVKYLKDFGMGFRELERIAEMKNETLRGTFSRLIHEIHAEDVPQEYRTGLAELQNSYPQKSERRIPVLPSDEASLQKLIANYPDNNFLMIEIGNKFIREKRVLDAVKAYEKHLEVNPLQVHGSKIYTFIERLANSNAGEASVLARAIRKRFKERFPSEANRFAREGSLDLENWVTWDLTTLAKKAKAEGADVVLQSYHYHLKPPVNFNVIQVRNGIVKAAVESKSFYLDTGKDFIREYNARGKNYDRFFADQVHHPSVEGHRLISRLVYDFLNANELLPEELRNLKSQKLYKFSWE